MTKLVFSSLTGVVPTLVFSTLAYSAPQCGPHKQIVELLGTRGGNWEILATSAFVSIAVPLGVFFAMQKYLVRGLLAGSVK